MSVELSDMLCAFYEAIEQDASIGSSHISLYLALMRQTSFRMETQVSFFRSEVLYRARMSRRTFNKCMGDLQRLGYLLYEPSKDARIKSIVYFKRL